MKQATTQMFGSMFGVNVLTVRQSDSFNRKLESVSPRTHTASELEFTYDFLQKHLVLMFDLVALLSLMNSILLENHRK